MKKLMIGLILMLVLTGCRNKSEDIIVNGTYQYLSAPYKKYDDNELDSNFSKKEIRNIKKLYLPYVYDDCDDNEIHLYTFQESDIPKIEVINIRKKENNLFEVEVKFGQADYLYEIALIENKINSIEKKVISDEV